MTPLERSLDRLGISELDGIELAKAKALMVGYHEKWGDLEWQALSVEESVSFPIEGTDWQYAGKIDTLVTGYNQERVMVEHKTTTIDLSDQTNPYFLRLSFEQQLSRYHLAMYVNERPLTQSIYDIIRKLSIKPKSIPKGTERKPEGTQWEISQYGTYYGLEVGESVDCKRPPTSECLRLYFLRCLHTVLTQSDKYYCRVGNIYRTGTQLLETYDELEDIVKDIDAAAENERWYQNTNMCNSYNSPCEYISLCRGTSNEEDDRWRHRKGGDTSGQFTLSHSKAGCFMTCRRKYYYRYVRQIEPNREKSSALVFGSAFHEALEEYWKARMIGENDDRSNNEVAS